MEKYYNIIQSPLSEIKEDLEETIKKKNLNNFWITKNFL